MSSASGDRHGRPRPCSLERQLERAQATLGSLQRHGAVLERVAEAIVALLRRGNKILTCGNGGSAAQAMHLSTELVGRFRAKRRPLPALFLGADATLLTCITNDFAYDDVFAQPLLALGARGDLLLVLTTSGNPNNVVRALAVANELGLGSFALLGKGGGRARGMATWEVVVDSDDTARIQEAHQFILHWLCEHIDAAFA